MQKTAVLILVLGVFLYSGCKKNNDAFLPALLGNWELREVHGGFTGSVYYSAPGNGIIYKFSRYNVYEFGGPGIPSKKGTFKIIKEYVANYDKPLYRIIFDNEDIQSYLSIENDKLDLSMIVVDGGTSVYQKIQ